MDQTEKRKSMFFFEKKNQKTFACSGMCRRDVSRTFLGAVPKTVLGSTTP
jgi:hypothetical protein